MGKRIVILDRDGVINVEDGYITTPEDWRAIPGSLEAIAQLCRADYRVVVITNQSGIAKGLYSINTLNRIHQKLMEQLHGVGGEIDSFFFCPHAPDEGCECRKPKPGMFRELAERLQCDLRATHAVGDSLRDLQAAATAGAKPALVATGNGRATARALADDSAVAEFKDVPVYSDLAAFVETLLARETVEAAPVGE